MKYSFITLPVLTVLVACGPATDNSSDIASETTEVDSEASITNLADLDGTPDGPVYTKNAGDTLALSGYDAVSYFTSEAPVEGSAEHAVRYLGYDYQFANAKNAAKFQEDPSKYTPQYGGYCAWAIGANDALAPGDPNVYKIVDGKLYLNFNDTVAKKWNADILGFVAKADVNYPKHDAGEHYTTN